MTRNKLFIMYGSITIYKIQARFIRSESLVFYTRIHSLARKTIASMESWIIRCPRLPHAVTIE